MTQETVGATPLQISDLDPKPIDVADTDLFGIDDSGRISWKISASVFKKYINNFAVLAGLSQVTGLNPALAARLIAANNLNDVESLEVSFNNISPLLAKGDIIGFDGTNNVRVPAGTNGYLIAYDSTQAAGLKAVSPAAAAAFVDNAIFTSSAGQSIGSATLTAINLSVLSQQSTGNTWTLNGDNTGMKCLQAGTYVFLGKIGIEVMSSTSANYGAVYGQFARNGTAHGESIPVNMLGPINALAWLPVYDMITCAANDVITLGVKSGTVGGTYSVVDPTAWAGSGSSVTIMRIN